jgi:hypothetical protein
MDRLRPDLGALGQPLGRTTSGGAERDRDRLREQDLEDGVDQCRLTDAGTAGDHQHLGNESDANSLSLAIGERQLRPLLDPRDGLVAIAGFEARLMPGDPTNADAAGAAAMRDTQRQIAETAAASKAQTRNAEVKYEQGEAASRAGRRKAWKFLTKRRSFRFTGRWMPSISRQAKPAEKPDPDLYPEADAEPTAVERKAAT